MRRLTMLSLALLVLAAACSDAAPAASPGPGPSVVQPSPPTTLAPTAPPGSAAPDPPATTAALSTEAPPPTITDTAPPPTVALEDLTLRLIVAAEGFDQPVLVTAPPGDPRLFVVDQPGRIFVVDGDEITTFLDIRDVVRFRGEQGLLGMAFHPDYQTNGMFYVDFIDEAGGTVLSEFAVDPRNPNAARPGTRRDILRVRQPAANHNGGMIAFGPDGLLWLGLGDGGGAGDRYGNGQRADRRLASMIRIEVGPDAREPFGDPVDQPFTSAGGLPEVWSIGLRNPWRWAFDGNDLYIADVGQGSFEEVNLVAADEGGLNFGWPILEGTDCFRADSCDESLIAPGRPLLTYSHRNGCSVTGGFVYRGTDIPELTGHYFFGDFCSGWIDSVLAAEDRTVADRRRWFDAGTVPGLTSFGVDGAGELYVLSAGGDVFRIERN